MKVLKQKLIGIGKDGEQIIAEIVEDLSEKEKEGFEIYELTEIETETISEAEKIGIFSLVKKYLKSYSENKDKIPLENWLMLMFKEDFPELDENEILKMKDETLAKTKESYKIYDEIKKAGKLGINSNEYFAMKIENSEEFKKLENKKEILHKLDKKLTNSILEKTYLLNEIDIEEETSEENGNINFFSSLEKILGQFSINEYIKKIEDIIEEANLNMQDTILNKDGSISQNRNLDGFIAESYHANTFNLDAIIKELGLKAKDLKPDVYGKNSVDIIIKEVSNGIEKIVRKYQAKFGKDFKATESYFKNKAGEYKYYFQRKLVGKEQVKDVSNSTDKVEYGGAESKPLSKAEVKEMQNKVQKGDKNALDLNFKKDVPIQEVLKRVGKKACKNAMIAMLLAFVLLLGKKIFTKEKVTWREIIESSIKAGGNSGVSTAIYGALLTASKKGFLKGIFANNNFISAIAFSTVEIVSVLYKIGSGEIELKQGLDNIAEIFTVSLVIANGITMAGGAGIVPILAEMLGSGAFATGVSQLIIGIIVTIVGTVLGKFIYNGVKIAITEKIKKAKKIINVVTTKVEQGTNIILEQTKLKKFEELF
ncbi:MAG: hypothetical protein ACLVH9_03755 [Fusobacterium sp.]|mgnify:CR=1 FL=1|uniref:hypothetical protein n=1 Tax=Fusobacterium sp. TaxID=68766 RepID=UPI00399BA134